MRAASRGAGESVARFWRAFVRRYQGRAMMLVVLLSFDAAGGALRLLSVHTLHGPDAFRTYLALYATRVAMLVLALAAPRLVARLFVPFLALVTIELVPVAGTLDDPAVARTYVTIIVALSVVVALFASLRELVAYLVVAGVVIGILVVPTQVVPTFAVIEASYSLLGCCFPAAVLYLIRTRLARATAAAQELARTDPLTGVLNRRGMQERLVEVAGRAWREGVSVWLFIVDLDHFKRINDQLGHLVGDEVLVLAATGVRGAACPGDVVARTGGEEFVVVAVGRPDGPMALGNNLRRSVAQAAVAFQVTASVGAAVAAPPGNGSPTAPWLDDLLRRADAALYEAKRTGRDRVVVAERAAALVRPRAPERSRPRESPEPVDPLG